MNIIQKKLSMSKSNYVINYIPEERVFFPDRAVFFTVTKAIYTLFNCQILK